LPKRSVRERITAQGLAGLPGLVFRAEGPVLTSEPAGGWEGLGARFREERRQGRLEGCAFTPDDAAGFFAFLEEAPGLLRPETLAVKGQCAGPVTLGLALRGPDGKPLLSRPEAMEALVEYLAAHALWQVRRLTNLGKPVVFFLDEPSWVGGKPGPDEGTATGWLERILGPLQDEGVLTGIHACGKGPYGWALSTSAEVLHVDASRYLDALRGESVALGSHLRRGGWIAFGLVPTVLRGGAFPETADLVERWMAFAHGLAQDGVDPQLLTSRTLFSTACGLGGGSQAVAEEAARCLSGLIPLWKITAKVGLSP
jgi:hypothetical protein